MIRLSEKLRGEVDELMKANPNLTEEAAVIQLRKHYEQMGDGLFAHADELEQEVKIRRWRKANIAGVIEGGGDGGQAADP